MLSFLFDLLSTMAHAAMNTLSFLVHAGMNVLSGIASLVTWPIKTALSALSNWWDIPAQWTPLYLLGCSVLCLLLLALAALAIASSHRKNSRR